MPCRPKRLPAFWPETTYLIAASPDGSVYVTNAFGDDVSQYSRGPGGVLVAKTPATVAAGTDPLGIAVSANAASVYVANDLDNSVSQYEDGPGGLLTAMSPAAVASGTSPEGVAARGPHSPFVANGFLICSVFGKATFNPPLLTGAAGVSTLTYKGTLSNCNNTSGIGGGKVEDIPSPGLR